MERLKQEIRQVLSVLDDKPDDYMSIVELSDILGHPVPDVSGAINDMLEELDFVQVDAHLSYRLK